MSLKAKKSAYLLVLCHTLIGASLSANPQMANDIQPNFESHRIDHGYCVIEESLPIADVKVEDLTKSYRHGQGAGLMYKLTYAEVSETTIVVIDLQTGISQRERFRGRKKAQTLVFTPNNMVAKEPLEVYLGRINDKVKELRLMACEQKD